MAEYMNKDRFLASIGLQGDETKYGNRDAEHRSRIYSTYMSYEIMDSVEDSIEQDVAPVVHGRWKPYHEADIGWDEYGVRCSKCRLEFTNEEFSHLPHNYCPNCGAKMDGGTHETD